MSADLNRTPEWLLERIALGELPEADLATAKAQLLAEPDGAARLQALQQSDQALQQDYPVRQMVAGIRERQRVHSQSRPLWARPWALALAAPVAAFGLLLWVALPSQEDVEITREKGSQTHLNVYRQAQAGTQRLLDGDLAAAGDVLQLRYQASHARFGAIYSVDGRGAWTRHWPSASVASSTALRLTQTGEIALPQAYELDDAPDFERFFLLSGDEDFELSAALAALKTWAKDPQNLAHKDPVLRVQGKTLQLFYLTLRKAMPAEKP